MATLVITPEIERDAETLATVTGKTPTEAVADAVRSKLDMVRAELSPHKIDVKALYEFLGTLPTNDKVNYSLTDDEILGYDELNVSEQPRLNGHR